MRINLAFKNPVWQLLRGMHSTNREDHGDSGISSPFSTSRATPRKSRRRRAQSRTWPVAGIAVLFALIVAGVMALNYVKDPFRKMEAFPTGKYFENYQPLAGLKFRSNLRVEADLGWKEGIGRLMVFTPADETRQLAVFIPPALSTIFFNKGQNYTMELEVKNGGLIYANSCRKN